MGPFWRAMAGGFAGKLLAVLFIAVCLALGFGPDKWASFMIAGLPEWWTPVLARASFIALAVLTMLILRRNSFNQGRTHAQTASAPAKAPLPLWEPPRADGRIFVSASVTPAYLIGLFKDHTGIQAKKLIEQYLGKWMAITGAVHDTNQKSIFNFSKPGEKVVQLFIFDDGRLLIARFSEPWVERIAILRRGDDVRFIGKIADVNAMNLELDDCELV